MPHDISTVTAFAYDRVREGLKMPGVIEVPAELWVGSIVEDILLMEECSDQSEWEGLVRFLPLR